MRFISALIFSFLCFSVLLPAQSLETIVQRGHELAVVCVAVSPDSAYVATGSKDKSVKLWDVATGREVRSFLGHEATVTSVTFTSDGKQLLTGSNDQTYRIWDVATGRERFSFSSPHYITAVAVDPKGRFFLASGYNRSGYADSITVYDLARQKPLARLPASADAGVGSGVDIAVSDDGKWVALGEDNRVATVYRVADWKVAYRFDFGEGSCSGCGTRVAFSPGGRYLYMASENGSLKKYDLANGALMKVYAEELDDMTGLAVSGNGKLLALATEKSISVWDEATGTLRGSLTAEEKGNFHEIAFYGKGQRLFVPNDNTTCFSWDVFTGKRAVTLTGYLIQRDAGGLNYDPNFYWQTSIAKYIRLKNTLLISRDGKTLLKGKFGTKVKRWDIATGQAVMEYAAHTKAVLCYALSRDGKRLLTGGGDGKIILWDVSTGDSLKTIEAYREPIFDVHFNGDETQVYSSSWDASMRIHDLTTGKQLVYVDLKNASAYVLAIHPSDLYVVTSRLDNTLQLWEPDTRSVVRTFTGHTDVVGSLRFSRDGRTLLSAGWDGSIRLWDVGTGLMTQKLRDHHGAVHTAIFSADEKSVYSAGADRQIRVWDVATGRVVRTFDGHTAEVTSLLFSPDNKMLISHSLDGITKFWDLDKGKEFFEHIHLGESDWLAKSPEGYFSGTDNARRYIHFVDGMKTYSIDQFFDEFYRPDLLRRLFDSRGGKADGKGLQGQLKKSPPPVLKVAVLPGDGNTAEVYVRITDAGGGARGLRLQHNGKGIVLNRDGLKFPSGAGEQTTYKHVVELVGGVNTFSAVASNRDNVESDVQSAEIFSDHPVKNGTCHIVAVGINHYANSKLNLNYAQPDAASFSGLVDSLGGSLFKSVELHALYDADATRSRILRTLDDLALRVSAEDVFIFYYAGHGSMVDNRFYFIPTESSRLYDASSLSKDALEASLLQEKFTRIKALKQLIIMDACQSGGSVELLATRGASEEKAIAQLSRSAGVHVMASAGSEQFATEFTSLGHGLFTYVLMKALHGAADGAPKDGKVTIYELKSYIDDQMPEMTRKLKGKPQYPYTFSRGQDFPLILQE